jgi:hypothetical protein
MYHANPARGETQPALTWPARRLLVATLYIVLRVIHYTYLSGRRCMYDRYTCLHLLPPSNSAQHPNKLLQMPSRSHATLSSPHARTYKYIIEISTFCVCCGAKRVAAKAWQITRYVPNAASPPLLRWGPPLRCQAMT